MVVFVVFYLLAIMYKFTEGKLPSGWASDTPGKKNLSGGGLWLDARKMNKLYVGEVGFILGAE